ncbi:MAG: hypothetical protein RMJ56_00585 [Gemmataceae bacterium]|nr:hypothetical protein [Gemmata sp.]MDW8196076.1 hypothetical protein [Gemmataceae bacterium]
MPTFLIDPPQGVYLLLGGLLIVTGLIAAQKPGRRAIIPFVVAFFLLLGVFILDRLVESPREEAQRRSYLLALAADAKNPDLFTEQIADNLLVHTTGGQTKTLTRQEVQEHRFWDALRNFEVRITVWDFSRDDVHYPDDDSVEIGFMGKGEVRGGPTIPVYIRTTYRRQADGSFKLSALRTFEALNRSQPYAIPQFP